MVTPPFCPGLNVEIMVDGQPLKEYNDIDEKPSPPNTVTKYIEAQTDANFAVWVRIDETFHFPVGDIGIEASVDGRVLERSRLRAMYMFCPLGTAIFGPTVELSPGTNVLHKLRFSVLQFGKFLWDSNQVTLESMDH